MEKFKFLEHEADIKFQAYGKTLDEAFVNSAMAFSSYVSSGNKISSSKGEVIEISGTDIESLLYNFLDELIYLIEVKDFLVSKLSVFLRGNNLKAELFGEKASKYEIKQVKAATYAEMHIKKIKKDKEEYWEIQAVLDV